MDKQKLTCSISSNGNPVVVAKPGISLTLYSSDNLENLMPAVAKILEAYTQFTPCGSLARQYQPPAEDDEYDSGTWPEFTASHLALLLQELNTGAPADSDEGYSFLLTSSPDGEQAGDFGMRFTGACADDQEEAELSCLRLDFPVEFLQAGNAEPLVDFFDLAATLFPFCSGNGGLAFLHTYAYVQDAQAWINQRLPQYLGFDSAHVDAMRLCMAGKSPPAHWINYLNADLLQEVGGENAVRGQLKECELKRLGNGGLRIRGAQFPPLADVNRSCPDIGWLPSVARVLLPIRCDDGLFTGLADADAGQEWLARFDNRESRNWHNQSALAAGSDRPDGSS